MVEKSKLSSLVHMRCDANETVKRQCTQAEVRICIMDMSYVYIIAHDNAELSQGIPVLDFDVKLSVCVWR